MDPPPLIFGSPYIIGLSSFSRISCISCNSCSSAPHAPAVQIKSSLPTCIRCPFHLAKHSLFPLSIPYRIPQALKHSSSRRQQSPAELKQSPAEPKQSQAEPKQSPAEANQPAAKHRQSASEVLQPKRSSVKPKQEPTHPAQSPIETQESSAELAQRPTKAPSRTQEKAQAERSRIEVRPIRPAQPIQADLMWYPGRRQQALPQIRLGFLHRDIFGFRVFLTSGAFPPLSGIRCCSRWINRHLHCLICPHSYSRSRCHSRRPTSS